MFIGYPARPVSREFTLEGLRFSDAAEGIALDLADQANDPSGDLAVGG
jgi:hypothetical protein